MHRIGVVDTMFARYDMGAEALDELASCPGHGTVFEVVHRTVPGFKDLAVAAKRLIENEGCRIVVALGMPGKAADRQGLRPRGLHGDHAGPADHHHPHPRGLRPRERGGRPGRPGRGVRNRARNHARNAYWMLYEPEQLTRRAGQGVRQGYEDAGPLIPAAEGAQPAGPRGRPRTLSPTMFRCTSEVPPPMVSAGEKR